MSYSLVLSGGGALGIAHIGVIENLKEKPNEIIGTSMGSIIGACLAIGLTTKEMLQLFKKFSNILEWTSYSYNSNSLIDTKKIERIFDNIFQDKKMKDTLIPLKIVATELESGLSKCFSNKDDVYIKDALLASMAIPGIFKEKEINNKIYVDGFLSDNLPVIYSEYENIVAIDVLGKNSYTSELPNRIFKTPKILDMVEKSMRLLIYNQTIKNINLLSKKKVLLIDVKTKEFKTFQFHKYKELYKIGRRTKIN